MQIVRLPQAFDGSHRSTVRLHCQYRTGFDGASVQQHRTGAAERCFATNVSSGEPGHFPKIMHQEQARLDLVLLRLAVDGNADFLLHVTPTTNFRQDFLAGGQR